MNYVRELVSQKLEKKCENGFVSSSGTAMNADENDSFPYSPTSNKAHKDERKDCISCINDLEVNNANSQKSTRNEEPASSNVYAEYFIEKLKNLIESRILLFDEQRQRKFTKKLRKIMKKDEKLEALQGLVEKMISILEDEQKMKLTKKYQKIMRRFQKMQDAKSSESDVHYKLNEAETSVKNYSEEGEAANCTEYSGGLIEMDEETKQLDSDIGFDSNGLLELQLTEEEASSNGKSKRRKREKMKVIRESPISSGLDELAKAVQELECDAVDIVPSPRRKNRRMKDKMKRDYDPMASFLSVLNT